MARTRQWILLLAAAVFLLAVEGAGSVKRTKANKGKCNVGSTTCTVASKTKVCVDLASDSSHCGKCNSGCKGSLDCVSSKGVAVTPSTAPSPSPPAPTCGAASSTGCAPVGALPCCCGLTCCTNATNPTVSSCVDTRTDKANCGTCGSICAGNNACDAGSCTGSLSLITSITRGPFSTTGADGSPTMVPRCLEASQDSQVPGYTLNVTQDDFRSLGIRTYSGTAPNPSWCLRASLCGMSNIATGTELTLSWKPPELFTMDGPEGPWETCTHENCPVDTAAGSLGSVSSNIIIPNTGNPTGEQLLIQSNQGQDVSGITIILRASRDCKYNTDLVGPL